MRVWSVGVRPTSRVHVRKVPCAFQLVARPDVVEMHDVTAQDPKLLVHLKATRNSVPVPRHWCFKRKYLQGKRGIEKPPFELPDFIKRTGIQEMREALQEKVGTFSGPAWCSAEDSGSGLEGGLGGCGQGGLRAVLSQCLLRTLAPSGTFLLPSSAFSLGQLT